MQRTLVLVKPDGVQRRLTGRLIARFEDKGLKLVALKLMQVDDDRARRMYAEHQGKDFYPRLVAFMTSAPVVAMALEGNEAVAVVRATNGATFGPDAAPGTIRGDFGLSRRFNLVHASDSPASAQREMLQPRRRRLWCAFLQPPRLSMSPAFRHSPRRGPIIWNRLN